MWAFCPSVLARRLRGRMVRDCSSAASFRSLGFAGFLNDRDSPSRFYGCAVFALVARIHGLPDREEIRSGPPLNQSSLVPAKEDVKQSLSAVVPAKAGTTGDWLLPKGYLRDGFRKRSCSNKS